MLNIGIVILGLIILVGVAIYTWQHGGWDRPSTIMAIAGLGIAVLGLVQTALESNEVIVSNKTPIPVIIADQDSAVAENSIEQAIKEESDDSASQATLPTVTSFRLETATQAVITTDVPKPVPTDTTGPIPTNTSLPIPTDTPLPTPADTETPVPTNTPIPTPTNTRRVIPSPTISPTPSSTPRVLEPVGLFGTEVREEFNGFKATVVDSMGDVYINNFCWSPDDCAAIFKYAPDGTFLGKISLEEAQLGEFSVLDLALDNNDLLYALDQTNRFRSNEDRIFVWDSVGNLVREIYFSTLDGGYGTRLFVDPAAEFYYVVSHNRINRYTMSGQRTNQWDADPDNDNITIGPDGTLYWAGFCNGYGLCNLPRNGSPFKLFDIRSSCPENGSVESILADSKGRVVIIFRSEHSMCIFDTNTGESWVYDEQPWSNYYVAGSALSSQNYLYLTYRNNTDLEIFKLDIP